MNEYIVINRDTSPFFTSHIFAMNEYIDTLNVFQERIININLGKIFYL